MFPAWVSVSLRYYVTVLPCYCFTALLLYRFTVLPYYCVTVLLCYCVFASLRVTASLRYYILYMDVTVRCCYCVVRYCVFAGFTTLLCFAVRWY